ncbi:MAG TPA: toast rack family protein [Chloroflexia bacterium]|nr:toast rack family protein [Chloroflexia bacterium]
MGEDGIKKPPLSQDTPPHPWTPPPQFGSEAGVSRGGITVDVGETGSSSGSSPGSAPPNRGGQSWAGGRGWDGKGHRHGTPILGPIFLILAGVLFLLNNMGVLPWAIWGQLWRLWPLVLIAIGLDMLFGRRSPGLSLLIMVGVLAGGAAFLYYTGGFDPGKLVSSQLSEPLGNARSADVSVHIGTSELYIDGKASGEQLVAGTLEYYDKEKEPARDVNRNGDRVVINLEQRGDGPSSWFNFDGNRSPRWDLHLATGIPVTLKVDVGTGNTNLDLSALKLERLEVDAGTGNILAQLPSPQGTTPVVVDAGTGSLDMTIPEGVAARIKVSTGTGNTNVASRFQKQSDELYESNGYSSASNKLDLDIDLGTGNVEIR